MPTQDTLQPPNPLVESLRARLRSEGVDHERFTGAPADISALTPLELGSLWVDVRHVIWNRSASTPAARDVADAIVQQSRELPLVPALDARACLEVFSDRHRTPMYWPEAIECLSYMACEPPPELGALLQPYIDEIDTGWTEHNGSHYQAYAFARLIDAAAQSKVRDAVRARYNEGSFRLREFELLDQLGYPAVLALAGKMADYFSLARQWGHPDPADALVDEPAYVEFAREILSSAAQRIEDIHAGRAAYVADGAFLLDDSQVLARAARVASLRDDAWFRDIVPDLLPRLCVAPTAAKTAPSQSLAIALGHSIESVPTPESVHALREALRVVRHAGLKKKLARNLKPAERALAERPDMALRMTRFAKPGKRQSAMLATCIEAGFLRGFELSGDEWRARLALTDGGAPIAKSLVWIARVEGLPPQSFLLDQPGDPMTGINRDGSKVSIPAAARIALWHPLHAQAEEREAWQNLLIARRIRQPIRQAFREHYHPEPDERPGFRSEMFAGHTVSIRPLIGLARREGWKIDTWSGLQRQFADVWVTFQVGAELYPGLQGWCETGDVVFTTRHVDASTKLPIAKVPPVVFSEACRAVDLLVSVTGFAIETDDTAGPMTLADLGLALPGQPAPARRGPEHPRIARMRRLGRLSESNLSEMARMRRNVLTQALASQIAAGKVTMEDRHVGVGPYAVHLATARITRAGAPVALEALARSKKLAALPWLPYDENLLQRIADAVAGLLEVVD